MICQHCNMPAPDTNYKCPHCGKILQEGVSEPLDFRQKAPSPRPSISAKALIPFIFLVAFALIFYFMTSKEKKGPGGKTYRSGTVINSDDPGEVIEIEDFVQVGKITYFYFFSPGKPLFENDYINFIFESSRYDPPPDLIYKVDINRAGYIVIDYESPLAQYYGIKEVPYLIIYDASGNCVFDDIVTLKYDTGRR